MVDALKVPGPTMQTEGAFLHQLLHGYSEGHRLLESSMTVPDDLARLVLRMSDLSGSNVSRGFEEYLTGYPLTSINSYALAKTWYAPEMPRPGCVWTHTIVVPASAMAEIPSLDALHHLFKRPSEHPTTGFYAKPIPEKRVLELTPELEPQPKGSRPEMQAVLSFHYGKGSNPVLLAARESKEFEDIIFAVWSQKWPSLRMGFTFCTGSLSARNYDKRPLDIQCVPTSLTREVSLEIAAAGSGEPVVVNSVPSDPPAWAIPAATDAWCPEGGAVRHFLWKVSDGSSGRGDFASFMIVFDALGESTPLPDLITLVASVFPQPTSGRRLKSLLFERQSNNGLLRDREEQDILFALAVTQDYESFDVDALSIKERAEKLCVQNPDSARWLVGEFFRSTLNPLGEEIMAGLISAMAPETALQVTSKQPQFLPALFRAKPSLASSAQLWRAGGDRKRELFEAVAAHDHLDPTLVAGIIGALLESGSEVFIRRALDRWGKDAVFATLDWTEAHNGAMSETSREALGFHLPSVMDWVEAGPTRSFDSLIAVAHIVAPYSSKVAKRDCTVWLRTFRDLQVSKKDAERTYIAAFLVALAFNNAAPSALDLLSESFERVHEAARAELLSDSAWVIVEPFVPELSWLSSWDKCERLRRGLISAFVRYGWPASELKRRIRDHELLRQLVKSATKVDGGDEFVRLI